MHSVRWQKVRRDLTGNRTRTVLVVLSIAIGVFAVGTIAGSNALLNAELQRVYRETNPSNAWIGVRQVDDDVVAGIAQMRGVSAAEGRLAVTVRMQTGPDTWRDLDLSAVRDLTAMTLDLVEPESGAWPPDRRDILIERASLGLTGHALGDTLTIETPDGRRREVRISGTSHEAGAAPAVYTGTAAGHATLDTLEALGYDRGYNQVRVTFDGAAALDRSGIQARVDDVRRRLERGGTTVDWTYVPVPGKHPANDILQGLFLILSVLGGLSLLVSGFLVVNTISAILSQQTRQIGVMKAIGARGSQIAGLYLGLVLAYSALSLGVALPLGALGAYAMTVFTANLVNFDVVGVFAPPSVLALEVAVGLVVPLIAALVPVLRGVRITAREAMSSVGIGERFGHGRFDRLLGRIRGLPRPTLLSIRNTFRKRSRLLLTLSALVLGGAVFMSVFTIRTSLLRTLDDVLDYFAYDVQVDLESPTRTALTEPIALAQPGVVSAESWSFTGAQRVRPDGQESRTFPVFGVPVPTQTVRPRLNAGRWLDPADENAVVITSNARDDDPDLEVGGQVVLKVDGRDTTWTIVGIVQAPTQRPFYYANRAYLSRVIREVGRANTVMVVTASHGATAQEQAGRLVRAALEAQGVGVAGTTTSGQIRQTQVNLFDVLVAFLSVMAILVGVVGGLGLMGTMSINVVERAREIGVLRAVGASDGSVLRIFLFEGLLIGLIAWAAGAVLSLPISRLLSDALGMIFIKKPLSYAFSVEGTVLWLGIVIVLAALASFVPAWRAARLAVRDSLAYE